MSPKPVTHRLKPLFLEARKKAILDLSFQKITIDEIAEVLIPFLKNIKIHTLNLEGNPLSLETVDTLCDVLKKNEHLSKLNLSFTHLDAQALACVCAMLKINSAISSLSLRGNAIDAQGIRPLAAILRQNRSLQTVDLGDNHLGTEGMRLIAGAIMDADKSKEHQVLKILDLSYNQLGASGAFLLAAALKYNHSISTLNIAGNSLAEASHCLAEILKHNTTLQILNLRNNALSHVAMVFITKALYLNHTLIALHFENNLFNASGSRLVEEMLKHNTSLINVSGCKITPQIQASLLRNIWWYDVKRGKCNEDSVVPNIGYWHFLCTTSILRDSVHSLEKKENPKHPAL